MTISNSKHTRNRLILLTLGCFLLGYCLLTLLPWQPAAYGYNLDESWASAVHIAFRDRIQFGKDFIYTYGPYGFLRVASYYFPGTYGYSFGFSLLIAIAAWAGFFRLVRYCVSRRDKSVLFLIPILWFFPNMIVSIDSFQFAVLMLPLVLYFYVSKRITPALVLVLINASLASLIKQTYFLLAIAFIVLITIDEVGKLRRFPRVAPIYLAFIWVFWVFAAQDVANIPAYISNNLQVVRGFSASMGTPGHLDEVLLYMFGVGTFLILVAFVEWRNRHWWGMLPTLGLAAVFFITFKGAFTRHDAHALQATFNAVPIMSIFTAVLWSSIKNSAWRVTNRIKLSLSLLLGFSALLMTIVSAIVLHHYIKLSLADYALNTINFNRERIPQVGRMLSGQSNALAIAEQGRAAIRADNVLPPISGTVDLYPNEMSTIFAYDLEYQPRPTVQSFSAYTPHLARLNRDHLTQSDAADNILFDLNPIDRRLPSFEDGLSWPEILTRYDITDIENRYLLLQRNAQPRQYQIKPTQSKVKVSMNEWFDVGDAQQPVWGEIDIHPNLIGKLTTAILRLPPLNMEIETADGLVTGYRTIGDIMSEGFLLSPVLSSRWDFADFASSDWQDRLALKQVKRFRIVADGFNAMRYPAKYQVSLNQLEFTRQSFAEVAGKSDETLQIRPTPLEGYLQKANIDGSDEMGWLAHAPMKMAIRLSGAEQSFSTDFGILDDAVQNSLNENIGDGVEFKIFGLTANGEETLLFARNLQPRENEGDRGTQKLKLDLSQINISQLVLETAIGKDASFDSSYWSNLRLE